MEVLESKYPILVLSYDNCELYCCHLDGYKTNKGALLTRLASIEAILASKPANSKFRIWFNIDDNKLDTSSMKAICESIKRLQSHINKIAFIGLRGINKWKYKYIIKQTMGEAMITMAYFTDAELAKGWLV